MSDQMDIAVSRRLLATSRAFQQLADQTIKKDPVRALVELITNSDDSYKKLERLGIENDGSITIKFKRARGSATLRITDHGLGMSSELMDEAVGMYGSETHGFEEGQGGRSFFGRGLKEAILSMGGGFVQSIQNNFFHQCVLNIEEYKRAVPKEATQLYKDDLEIPSRGTKVTLTITRAGIKIPQFETLRRTLELHYALRDILSSPKRNIVLIELGQNDKEEHRVKLEYIYPKRDLIITTPGELPEFDNAKIALEIYKSEDPLSGREEGYMRQSGILVCSKGAIHDISLFKFEGEELARSLSGRVICDYIDVLLRRNESIVLDSRDGLDWSHSFNKALRLFVEQYLEKYIIDEKKKQKEKHKPIESELMKKKFRKTLDKLNAIAEAELKEFEKVGTGDRPGSMLPPNGFDFLPNYYHVVVGKKSTLTLKIMERTVKNDREVVISSDSLNIRVLSGKVKLDFSNAPMQVVHIYIEGKQIGDVGRIVAKIGSLKAEATIHVVAEKNPTTNPPPPNQKHRGMFKEIIYDPNADPHQRVRYDRLTGTIIIATASPSVRLYLGADEQHRFEDPENLVMTAELVTQAVCRELAKRKYEFEPGVGEPEETLNAIYNKLIDQYAHIIHSLIGPLV